MGTRVPADGAGYAETPVATETHVAGVYADKPDVEHGGTGWTQLDVLVAGRRYSAADASAYRQALDLRRGRVITTATWSAGGRVTRLAYEVALDRARERVGVVRLRLTPSWSGRLQVRDVLGAGADLTPGGCGRSGPPPTPATPCWPSAPPASARPSPRPPGCACRRPPRSRPGPTPRR